MCQGLCQSNFLLPWHYVLSLPYLFPETFNNIVSLWIVDFLQSFLKLELHIDYLFFKLLDFEVFLVCEELKILSLVQSKLKFGFALKIALLRFFFQLDNFQVELVVFLHNLFILLFQGLKL